jgi:hypothetical protein
MKEIVVDTLAGFGTILAVDTISNIAPKSESVEIAQIISACIITIVHVVFGYLMYKERKQK